MPDKQIEKILVALDGSDRSVRTVKYLAGLTALVNAEVRLFHVFRNVPASHYDLAREPSAIKMSGQLLGWEQHQRQLIEKHLERCRKILLAANFDPKRVKTVIHDRQHGVARDLIATVANARKPYDAVIIRRRGMGRLAGVVIGSVAFKMLDGLHMAPLVFAGRKPDNKKILIGMDLSGNAMRAVDFVGRMTQGRGYTIALAVVVRRNGTTGSGEGADADVKAYENALEEAFEQARERLAAYGFDREEIDSRIIRNKPSRAGALVEFAEADNYNTIVVGRKGVTNLDDFLIGRVSHKILHVGRKHNVWIVN